MNNNQPLLFGTFHYMTKRLEKCPFVRAHIELKFFLHEIVRQTQKSTMNNNQPLFFGTFYCMTKRLEKCPFVRARSELKFFLHEIVRHTQNPQ